MTQFTRLLNLSLLASAVALAGCDQNVDQQSSNQSTNQSSEQVSVQNATSSTDTVSGTSGAAAVDQDRLLAGTNDPHQWAHYGGSYDEHRFSPLDDINTDNVSDLGLAWFADYDTNQNQHGSPLYIDGVIYVSTARNVVHAFDARNGERIWTYTPILEPNPNLGLVNRGIAAFDGKIYMGMLDAHLVALDANTGEPVWNINTVPESLGLGDMASQYSITMAPRVAKGKVFIGGSGGEFGARGWIAAFDAQTGEEDWRFWTVPGNPDDGVEGEHLEVALETWPDDIDYWVQGGGGTVWDGAIYDPETDLLYFGTGNGTPWNREMRDPDGGDNLYVASVVAVNPDTGEYVWHYQETPGDSWDYDATSPMLAMDLTIEGEDRRVIVHPSKNGFLYVLDAHTGELISADTFTSVTWASGVDMETGRPDVVPGARYTEEPFNVGPGAPGGHTWHPNAYSPETGLVYIPTWENFSAMVPQQMPEEGLPPLIAFGGRVDRDTLKPHGRQADNGWLQAWDPVNREVVWETEKGARATSGVLASAGNLVFMGNSGGNQLKAYNAETGEQLWDFDTQSAVFAAPITYELDGEQYIAASVGGTSSGGYFAPSYGRMLVFKVGGTQELPEKVSFTPRELNPPESTASAEVIALGSQVYGEYCAVCHGGDGVQQRSSFPNLTVTPLLHTQAGFDLVVLEGGRINRGMADFSDRMTEEDSAAVREYLIAQANILVDQPNAFGRGGFGPQPEAEDESESDDVHAEAAGE